MNAIDHTLIRESAERQCDEVLDGLPFHLRQRAALAIAQRHIGTGEALTTVFEHMRCAERNRCWDTEAARTAAEEMVEAAERWRDEIHEETAQ